MSAPGTPIQRLQIAIMERGFSGDVGAYSAGITMGLQLASFQPEWAQAMALLTRRELITNKADFNEEDLRDEAVAITELVPISLHMEPA